jgi:hypothetical protein
VNQVDEITEYVSEVRAALADLPQQAREELLEDLPEHLAEVAAEGAEGEESLRSRLGPPEQYAAELRATVDVGPPRRTLAAGAWRTAAQTTRIRLRAADVRFGRAIGYGRASEYLRLLRPGWWLLRGYLAAMVVASAMDFGHPLGLLPRFVANNTAAAVAVLVAFMVGSIWLGRREERLDRWPRRALDAGSILLALVAFIGFATVDGDATRTESTPYQVVDNSQNDSVRDLFPYDANGRLLRNVRMFDENGNPVLFRGGCESASKPMEANAYPRCPEWAPFGGLETGPDPTTSPAGTPAPSPTG